MYVDGWSNDILIINVYNDGIMWLQMIAVTECRVVSNTTRRVVIVPYIKCLLEM